MSVQREGKEEGDCITPAAAAAVGSCLVGAATVVCACRLFNLEYMGRTGVGDGRVALHYG